MTKWHPCNWSTKRIMQRQPRWCFDKCMDNYRLSKDQSPFQTLLWRALLHQWKGLLSFAAHKKDSNKTELSKHIWKLKKNNQDYTIKWSIIKHAISYTGGSKRCNLCLEEKFWILKDINKDNLLNKRSEIFGKCRHKNRFRVNRVVNKILWPKHCFG